MARKQRIKESEQLYRNLVERANDGIIILQDKLIKYINPRMAEIVGYKIEEFTEAPFTDHIYPEELPKVLDYYSRRMAGEDVPTTYESILKHKDGHKIFIEANASITTYQGKPADFVIVRDITQRKQAEKALQESEKRFRLTTRAGNTGVWDWNLETDEIYLDPFLKEMLGYQDHEIRNHMDDWIKYVHPEDLEEVSAATKASLENTMLEFNVLHRMLHKDGSIRWFLARGSVIQDETGKPYRMVGTDTDITELKKAEEALKESEEMYRTLLNTTYDAVGLYNLDGSVIEVSKNTLDLFGFENEEEYLEINPLNLIAPEDQEKAMRNLQRILKEGFVREIEYNLLKKDGTTFVGELNAALVRDFRGEPKYFIVVLRDITERKRAEDEMKRKLMKFNLKEGNLYLLKEPTPALSIEAIRDICKIGGHCLVISRTPEEELRKAIGSDCNYLWLGELGQKALPPELKEIEKRIANLPKKNAVLIDRLDYLISKNGFKKILSFVQHLKDLAYFNDLIVILSVDSDTFDRRELRLLEKETKEIEPQIKIKLSDGLLEVLKFIYNQNNRGIRPILSDIGKELGISRPTVNNRIRLLVSGGYLKEDLRGRKKFLELTEKGWRLFID